MTSLKKNTLAKYGLIGILGMSTLTLGACSTTPGISANGGAVPITYKVDQGQFQTVSVTQPYRSVSPRSQPQSQTPRSIAPSTKQNEYVTRNLPTRSQFDQSRVDTDLYAHQKVGKTYEIMGKHYTPKHQPHYNTVGTASWYGDKFHGRPTATGELYDMDDLTAAHKTLPLNSMVYVTNMETGKGMMVRVNDRGPFVGDRIIDLSRATARELGMFTSGLGRVRVQYAGPADPMAPKTNKRPIKRPSTKDLIKEPTPNLVAELPKLAPRLLPKALPKTFPKLTQDYKSLRDFGKKLVTPPAQQAALPVAPTPKTAPRTQFPFQPKTYINPLLENRAPTLKAPTVPQSAQTPQQYETVPLEDGPITLTIKGPVHMASDKSDSENKARFIPAVNYTVKPAK